ncbi:sensor histidine kinase [Stakelama tenebrarum]|uniref:histidine kinase n=1 Tax=Stakelama tenebrarum TaxID=2711215 RepID=A0A6G6Y759_9SPHN|nr:ATP-binding protein [Sphingosinithalassobacter tenebrarum]QIG80413.1 HAMP domain-containing protein [Sphingosinithalassobacter tenebrarum]
MTRVRLWPRGLTGRVTLVLLAAILIEFFGTILVFGEAEKLLLRTGQAHRVAEQLVVADRVLRQTPPDQRANLAPRLSTRHVVITLRDTPLGPQPTSQTAEAAAREFRLWEPELRDRTLEIGLSERGSESPDRLIGALSTNDGQWIHFRSIEPIGRWAGPEGWLPSLILLVFAVLLVSALLVRTLAAPLRALAAATNRIGVTPAKVVVEPDGPQELRRLAIAFNAMQTRISELLESRTRALLAVSHDLRTPLSRMKLRIHGRLRAGDLEALRGDVDEMQAMLDSLLDFLGGGDGTQNDPAVRTDLATFVAQVAGDMRTVDPQARAIRVSGPDRLDVMTHRNALRRGLSNLIDNAVKYGGEAEIEFGSDGGWAWIEVRDHGPGIAPDLLPQVIKPFIRGDAARARDTKGFGLGLAVVMRVAKIHDGSFTLRNASPGLIAQLTLPIDGRKPQKRDETGNGNVLIRF